VRNCAQNEYAARELAKVEPEDRAGIVQAIVQDGGGICRRCQCRRS
jgi:hypothetical protein